MPHLATHHSSHHQETRGTNPPTLGSTQHTMVSPPVFLGRHNPDACMAGLLTRPEGEREGGRRDWLDAHHRVSSCWGRSSWSPPPATSQRLWFAWARTYVGNPTTVPVWGWIWILRATERERTVTDPGALPGWSSAETLSVESHSSFSGQSSRLHHDDWGPGRPRLGERAVGRVAHRGSNP